MQKKFFIWIATLNIVLTHSTQNDIPEVQDLKLRIIKLSGDLMGECQINTNQEQILKLVFKSTLTGPISIEKLAKAFSKAPINIPVKVKRCLLRYNTKFQRSAPFGPNIYCVTAILQNEYKLFPVANEMHRTRGLNEYYHFEAQLPGCMFKVKVRLYGPDLLARKDSETQIILARHLQNIPEEGQLLDDFFEGLPECNISRVFWAPSDEIPFTGFTGRAYSLDLLEQTLNKSNLMEVLTQIAKIIIESETTCQKHCKFLVLPNKILDHKGHNYIYSRREFYVPLNPIRALYVPNRMYDRIGTLQDGILRCSSLDIFKIDSLEELLEVHKVGHTFEVWAKPADYRFKISGLHIKKIGSSFELTFDVQDKVLGVLKVVYTKFNWRTNEEIEIFSNAALKRKSLYNLLRYLVRGSAGAVYDLSMRINALQIISELWSRDRGVKDVELIRSLKAPIIFYLAKPRQIHRTLRELRENPLLRIALAAQYYGELDRD